MPTITAVRLGRIRNIILNRVLQDFPEARFITDTQIVLDVATGGVMNLDNLLSIIESNDEKFEDQIIADYLKSMGQALKVGLVGEPELDRRRILGSVTKMIYPAGAMPNHAEPIPLTDTLEYVYALHEDDMTMAQPLSKLTPHVSREELDAAAHAKLKAYARSVSVVREMGGVLLKDRKQTPSIALCIEECARVLKLPKCEHGWLVAMPTRSSLTIVPATNAAMFLALVELNTSTHVQAPDPLSPWIYYVKDGVFHELLGPGKMNLPQELRELHGPFDDWPVVEDYWGEAYAEDLG